MKRPYFELQKIFSFISSRKLNDAHFKDLVKRFQPQLLTMKAAANSIQQSQLGISTKLLQLSKFLIEDEINTSNGLTQWPCRSFLELEKDKQISEESKVVRYYELSADCSDPYVKCSVRFDQNEQKK